MAIAPATLSIAATKLLESVKRESELYEPSKAWLDRVGPTQGINSQPQTAGNSCTF